MGKSVQRIASYLSALPAQEYGISGPISAAANYILDSYFSKVAELKLRSMEQREYIPSDLDGHIKELWLGCEIHKAISINRTYPSFARTLNSWAFVNLFRQYAGDSAPYELVPFLDSYKFKEGLKHNYRYKIQYEQMNIKPGVDRKSVV